MKKKRKGKVKGVQYVDEGGDCDDPFLISDQHGHPTWRMENRNTTHSEKRVMGRIGRSAHNYEFSVFVYIHTLCTRAKLLAL